MSLTPRKAASLLGAAALGVTAMTGAGSAAGSTARASVARPSFSKLSPSQVKARSSGKRERRGGRVRQPAHQPAGEPGPPARPGSNGRVHAGSARSPAEAGRGHAHHDPFAPQRCRGDNAGGRGTGTQPYPGRQGGRPRRNHHHRGRPRRTRTTVATSRVRKSTIPATAADGQQLCNASPSKPLMEPEALTSIHDASNNPNDPIRSVRDRDGPRRHRRERRRRHVGREPQHDPAQRAARDHRCPGPERERLQRRVQRRRLHHRRPGHGHLHLRVSAALLEHPRELQLPNRG